MSTSATENDGGPKEALEMEPQKEALDIEPVTMTWEDIQVVSKAKRTIIDGVSGIAFPGETLALMGASGAGKTTLLNTLLNRNLKGLNIKGRILCNGHSLGRRVTCVSAYIQQEDIFVGSLTVREHLLIQAMLKMSKAGSRERGEKVDQIMAELGLTGSQHSRIGISGIKKGISGGEAKRLSFAGKLLSNPSIMFCDEPTTGLDSFMAASVVTTLHHLARKNQKTIICTIHSPAAEVFEKFDKVMFVAGGKIAYHGTPEGSYSFFAQQNIIIPPNCNVADVIIHNLAMNPADREASKKKITKITDNYLQSDCYKQISSEIKTSNSDKRPLKGKHRVSAFKIIQALWFRTAKDIFRNPAMARAKLFQKVFMGFFLGFLYFRGELNQDGVISFKGALFYYIAELTYATIFGIQSFVPRQFPLLCREYHDGIYPVSCFYISSILAYLPLFTIDGICMVSISYWLIGLNPSVIAFFRTLAITTLIEWSAVSVGVAVSSAAPSYAVAVSISGPLLTLFSLTGGLYTNVSTMHPAVRWVQYLSWFRFGYESLSVNQWQDYGEGDISTSNNANQTVAYSESSGSQIIKNLNFDIENMYFNMVCMSFYIIGVYLIGYIGLTIRVLLNR